ncbi:hypothetical protein DM2_1076 [Halorubrum sp. DM2]|nr:hypothetical protein DM2_1076 [Halorubrum sp. DM2]
MTGEPVTQLERWRVPPSALLTARGASREGVDRSERKRRPVDEAGEA